MSAVSFDPAARARKNETIVLQRLATVGLESVAEFVGVDESTVSRWKSKEIPQLMKAAARLGLKVVPVDLRCYRADVIESLLALARARLQNIQHANELAEDDE